MIRYRAAWVVPIIGEPIENGWVDVADGFIVDVGSSKQKTNPIGHPEVDLSESLIMPGLVNAHTHLELSGLRGQIPKAQSMPRWTRKLLSRTTEITPDDTAIRSAVYEAQRSGTVLVGDISNTLASVEPLRDAGMMATVFKELLGFDERTPTDLVAQTCNELSMFDSTGLRFCLAAHAPYSVSPALFGALRAAAREREFGPLSVHVAESLEEVEFLQTGTGEWREILEERGRWDPGWTPSNMTPVEYLDSLGWCGRDTLMVHGVQLTDSDLSRMVAGDVTLVTCPRSNNWTGAGHPPVDRFYASGVRVAVGTDSLASVIDLNLFSELHELRRLGSAVPASAILRSATQIGAEALGFGGELGVIAPGYRALLVAVRYAEAVGDVEEYLVNGIKPEQVTWITEAIES